MSMTMTATVQDDLFSDEVIANPYAYYGQLREEDPVHWNENYALWVITRHDDLVWLTRQHELFSSAVFLNDRRPAYPPIDESDLGLYEYVKNYQGNQFIQHDRPEHLEMRRVMHGYFTPKSMEAWRPFVTAAVKELLDAAEAKGSMDVMRDLATPLPVLERLNAATREVQREGEVAARLEALALSPPPADISLAGIRALAEKQVAAWTAAVRAETGR